MVSETHGFDVALPLRSSPPSQETEEGAEEAAETWRGEPGEGAPRPARPARPPSAGANKKTPPPPPAQAPAKGADKAANQERREGCDSASTEISDHAVWEEQDVPASKESFFFAVPPLFELVGPHGRPVDQEQDATPAAAASTPGEESGRGKPQPAPVSPTCPVAAGGDHDGAEAAAPEEVNTTVRLLVSLNGSDWHPVSGPSLTYVQPPPEPVVEPEEETKKGKGRKK